MIRYARITRCNKNSATSPGWFTPDQFKMIAAERYLQTYANLLPEEFIDRTLIENYVISWNLAKKKFAAKDYLVKDKLSYKNATSNFFVITFSSIADMNERNDFINQSPEMQNFEAARLALANFLQVKIDVYEPVELDMGQLIDADTLTTVTAALD